MFFICKYGGVESFFVNNKGSKCSYIVQRDLHTKLGLGHVLKLYIVWSELREFSHYRPYLDLEAQYTQITLFCITFISYYLLCTRIDQLNPSYTRDRVSLDPNL